MPLFGKKHVHEIHAAQQFLQQLRSEILSNWPAICETLSESIIPVPEKPNFAKHADNAAVAFEFYLAVVAMQMRAINTLFPNDQAARIHKYIDQFLEAIPPDTLQELLLPCELYLDKHGFEIEGDKNWDGNANTSKILKIFSTYTQAFTGGDPVISGPAYFFCRRLNFVYPPSVQYFGDAPLHPLLTAVVFKIMTDIGGGWWKKYLQRHNVIA